MKKIKFERVYCDMCGELAYFDDKTKDGLWAYMCRVCQKKHGMGVGTEFIIDEEENIQSKDT